MYKAVRFDMKYSEILSKKSAQNYTLKPPQQSHSKSTSKYIVF